MGISMEYREQPEPKGIAQAFLIAEDFIGSDSVTLILGDNVFYGTDAFQEGIAGFVGGATIFGYRVHDPERYGVVEFDAEGRAISIEEKPKEPKSSHAVPGLYVYDNEVIGIARGLEPSGRGELEITDVNVEYLRRGQLRVLVVVRGPGCWSAGTCSRLLYPSDYVDTNQTRQGVKIGCPEEAAFRRGFLSLEAFAGIVESLPVCEYRDYLHGVVEEGRRTAAEDGVA